ncbi:MAG: NAD(P)H-hydrate epimerase, partial [bacterium]
MKVVTGEQMRALDQKAIKGLGIPGVILMEHAGMGVVEEMACRWDALDAQRIAICCGAGNNGGDGLVVARHLMNRGLRPEVFLFADMGKVRGDARINLDVLLNMGGRIYVVSDQDSLEVHGEILKGCDIIVDAIFGTGLKPPVQGFLAEVIRFINELHKQVVAVDIPSGLGADSPLVEGPCIDADLTVTFALPKVSHLLPPAMGHVGTLTVVDIGIPPFLVDEAVCAMTALDRPFLTALVRRRSPDSHKGTYGHCLIIAGSEGKTGAAYLAAQGALRIGAGLVSLALPRSLNDIMEVKLTEAMTIPLPETAGRAIAPEAWDALSPHISKFSAIVVGPGLSQHPGTGEFVRTLVSEAAAPLVIDADALNLIAGGLDLVKQSGHAPILTPHPGEMARLIGSTVSEVLEGRPEIVRQEAV